MKAPEALASGAFDFPTIVLLFRRVWGIIFSIENTTKEVFVMRDGFIKVAAGTPKIKVADCRYNAEQIFTLMREADKQGVKVLCLPELCLTGYTCGDLFLHDTLLKGAEEGLQTILEATRNLEVVTAVGLPVRAQYDNKLYNLSLIHI